MHYPSPVFPSPSVCPKDLASTSVKVDQEPVHFYHIGELDVVDVVGVPMLNCATCQERTYDLNLLARIEGILRRYTADGSHRRRYTFHELAAELGWPAAGGVHIKTGQQVAR